MNQLNELNKKYGQKTAIFVYRVINEKGYEQTIKDIKEFYGELAI